MDFPIETQEQFDAAIKDRLERERRRVRAEVEAEHAEKLKAAEDKATALEKAAAEREESERVAKLRAKVSKETGVPEALISGEDEESMTAWAKEVAAYAKKPAAPKLGESGKFSSKAKTGGADDDMRSFAAQLFGESQEG